MTDYKGKERTLTQGSFFMDKSLHKSYMSF